MALSDLLYRLLSRLSRKTGLSLWSVIVATVVLYFAIRYFRKRREYRVCYNINGRGVRML